MSKSEIGNPGRTRQHNAFSQSEKTCRTLLSLINIEIPIANDSQCFARLNRNDTNYRLGSISVAPHMSAGRRT